MVADSLSRYYQSDTIDDVHPAYDFVNADEHLDPEGKDLPWNHIVEIHTRRDTPQKRPLRELCEDCKIISKDMNESAKPTETSPLVNGVDDNDPTIFES